MKVHRSPKSALLWKIVFVAAVTLLMLIPISMIKDQISDRRYAVQESISEIESLWGNRQTVTGPSLCYSYTTMVKDSEGKDVKQTKSATVYPNDLRFDVSASTQILHRSIYDVTVYTSEMKITGDFLIPAKYAHMDSPVLQFSLSDLRGIVGQTAIVLDGQSYVFEAGKSENIIVPEVLVDGGKVESGTLVPFEMTLHLKGSEELMFRPVGNVTVVSMTADSPNPSFNGDFLPIHRDISEGGFKAEWQISQINRGEPESKEFGVRMLQSVTQYQQTERSLKYGILIILLVFMVGLLVEFLTKTNINIVQYVVIGLSLVLFYSLLLAFSEFIAFGWAYLLASGMTVAALSMYFIFILRNRSAYMLGGLVACAYGISYMLLQMETYAFLCGTLILFVVLCVIMYFTANINKRAIPSEEEQLSDK